MDPEIQKRFEEFDARLRAAEKRILTTGNLVSKVGIPSLVDTQMKIDALMESDTRLYGALQRLTESHEQLSEQVAESIRQLTESQRRTEASLDRLSLTVQRFIDSMKSGNGSKS